MNKASEMKNLGVEHGGSPFQLITERIASLGDWRGEVLGRMRTLICETDPDITEECKWRGTPVWSLNGIVCTGESYKTHVKLTFAKGAFLDDPSGLFNSSLDGNVRRAIDIHRDRALDETAFQGLVRAAIAFNSSVKKKRNTSSAHSPKL